MNSVFCLVALLSQHLINPFIMGMQHLTLHFYRQHTALDTRRQTLQSLTFLFMDTHAKLVYILCIHSSKGDSNTEDVFKDEQASL